MMFPVIAANIAGQGFCEIEWREGVITSVWRLREEDSDEPYCSAGFTDLQVNGIGGVDFGAPDLTPEAAVRTLRPLWESGVTAFCPTVITNTPDGLRRSFQVLGEARRLSPEFAECAVCYHLEGPFLSPGPSHGAHNPELMRDPSWSEFAALQAAAGGRIGIVTLAPELPGAIDFIRSATAAGVVVAIGHTDGEAKDVEQAVEAGCLLSTHLGNGCPEYIHRHRSPIWAQLAARGLSASLICDGFHLTPEFVRAVHGLKGRERCILITDSIHVSGLPPGGYRLGGMSVELHADGKVSSVGNAGVLAGSTLRMNRAIARFREMAGIGLDEALEAATANPARLLSRGQVCGAPAPGRPANLVLFRPGPDEMTVLEVYVRGISRIR